MLSLSNYFSIYQFKFSFMLFSTDNKISVANLSVVQSRKVPFYIHLYIKLPYFSFKYAAIIGNHC